MYTNPKQQRDNVAIARNKKKRKDFKNAEKLPCV